MLYYSNKSNDQTLFLIIIKILITIIETFYPSDALNNYLYKILDIIITQIKIVTISSYKCFLLQAVRLFYLFNLNFF